jgi:hypothetical protein
MATNKQSGASSNALRPATLADGLRISGEADVTLRRADSQPTGDQALWAAIRNRTNAIGFPRYAQFINRLLCSGTDRGTPAHAATAAASLRADELGSPSVAERLTDLGNRPSIYGGDAYQLLKLATQAFMLFECGVVVRPPRDGQTGQFGYGGAVMPDEQGRDGDAPTFDEAQAALVSYLTRDIGFGGTERLPYLKRIASTLLTSGSAAEGSPYCEAVLQHRLDCPSMLELIWSYWHEQGMLVQTINTIALRFQNRRNGSRDPLAHLELDPLRPLSNLMWGYLQDEPHRLTLMRRAYEYDHEYGLCLEGKAVEEIASVDSRSKFIEAFHNLLYRTAAFYQEDADTTIVSDGFPLLNALKEVHMILAEGAHNQFGDLPWTSRAEMLMTQWLLARPELREFLRGRAMVPYREAWMGQVDTMKRIQGWSDVGINHFRDLGTFGEQLLLSIRYGDWIDIDNQEHARNWARAWKPEVQTYIHSYLAVTGVDLAADMSDTRDAAIRTMQPSVLLRNRIAAQQGSHVRMGAQQPELLAAPQQPALTMAAVPAPTRQRLVPRQRGN